MNTLARKIFEPDIEEIINDPIVAMLMHKDGVEKDPLLALLRETAGNLTLRETHPLQGA